MTVRAVVDNPGLVELMVLLKSFCCAKLGNQFNNGCYSRCSDFPYSEVRSLSATLLVVNAYAAAIFGRLKNLLFYRGACNRIIGFLLELDLQNGTKWPWLSELRTTLPSLFLRAIAATTRQITWQSCWTLREQFRVPSIRSVV